MANLLAQFKHEVTGSAIMAIVIMSIVIMSPAEPFNFNTWYCLKAFFMF